MSCCFSILLQLLLLCFQFIYQRKQQLIIPPIICTCSNMTTKPASLLGKKLSNHKTKSSFWRKHPMIWVVVLFAVLSIPLSSLLSSTTLLNSISNPLRAASLLWQRLQWTLFTEGKARLHIHDIFQSHITQFDPSSSAQASSHIKSIIWDTSLINQVVQENNNVTQSFLIAMIASEGDPVVLQRGPAALWALCKWDMVAQIATGRDVVLEGVRWQTQPLHVHNREREKGGMLGSAKSDGGTYVAI